MHIQAMLFISPGFTPQTGLSSTTETQGGSDWGRSRLRQRGAGWTWSLSLGEPWGCPGPPLCLWSGTGDRAVTQGRGLAHADDGGISWLPPLQTGSGTSGDTGLQGMGICGAQPGLAEPCSRLQPSTAASRDARLGIRWVPVHQAEMLSTQGCCIPLAPGRPVPKGQGAGDLRGSAPAGRFSSHPCRVSVQGGGRLLWHNLLALPLAAWGRNQVPCPTIAVLWWQDQAQPHSGNADGNNLPGHRPAGPCPPSPGKVTHTSTMGEALFLRGQGPDPALSSRHTFS